MRPDHRSGRRIHDDFGVPERAHFGGGRSVMRLDDIIGLVVAVALTAYLFYALFFPEKL